MGRSLTGLTPRQEQAYQEREQDKAARRLEISLYRSTLAAMRDFATAYDNPLRQETVLLKHQGQIGDILTREYGRAFDTFGKRMIDAAGKAHPGRFEVKDVGNLFMEFARAWVVARVGDKVTQIVNTTRKDALRIVKASIDEGLVEGLGQDAIGRIIRRNLAAEAATVSRRRANVIARTETHAAANSAAHEAIRSTGLPVVKEWVAAIDGRERDAHAEADGQSVPLNAPFVVDGEMLDYPGDPSGSAANVINCRCAVAHVVED